MPSRAPQEVLNIAKNIGNFIQHWGFKKIHGQIWTLVFLSKEPVNATIITKRLQVSKALVSLAVKDLLKYEVIVVAEKKNKEIYFKSNPDIFGVIAKVLETREKAMLEDAKMNFESLRSQIPDISTTFPVDPHKVEELGNMIDMAQSSLNWFTSTCNTAK